MVSSRRVVLHFPQRLVNQPVISRLVRTHDVDFNILKAQVTPEEEGLLVLELIGAAEKIDAGLEYLSRLGVRMQPLSSDVVRYEEKCTHCGACVGVCPSEALTVEAATRHVIFDSEKCIACGQCVRACPFGAMEVRI